MSDTERARVWVCSACGRYAPTRQELYGKDTSCGTHAVECWQDSLRFGAELDRVMSAKAVEPNPTVEAPVTVAVAGLIADLQALRTARSHLEAALADRAHGGTQTTQRAVAVNVTDGELVVEVWGRAGRKATIYVDRAAGVQNVLLVAEGVQNGLLTTDASVDEAPPAWTFREVFAWLEESAGE